MFLGAINRRRYSVRATPVPEAIAVLAALRDWFTFDGTNISALSSRKWLNNNNSSEVYSYSSSPLIQKATAQQPNRVSGFTGLTDSSKFFLAFWTDVPGIGTNQTIVGVGNNAGLSTVPYIAATMNTNAGVSTIFLKAFYSGSFHNFGSVSIVAGSRHFVVLNMDLATSDYELTVDNAVATSGTFPAAILGANVQTLCWFENTGAAAFTDIPATLDEFAFGTGITLTTAMKTYLWNGGSGKTLADVQADAA